MLERVIEPANMLSLAALMIMPLAVVVPMAITPLAATCAVCLAYHSIVYRRRSPISLSWYAAILALLLVWCALTALWSIDGQLSLLRWLDLAMIAPGAVVIIDAARTIGDAGRIRVENALIWGTVAGLALIAVEIAGGAAISRAIHGPTGPGIGELVYLNRGASLIAVLACLAALAVERRFGKLWVAPLVAAIVPILLILDPGAPVLAAAVGAMIVGLARIWPRLTASALALVTAICILATPLLPGTVFSSARYAAWTEQPDVSLAHRLVIWEFVAERVKERPWRGWGLDTARALPGGHDLIEFANTAGVSRPGELLPIHPHNAILQWWLELGLPGALMFGALVVITILAIPRCVGDVRAQAACLGTVAAVAIIASLSYGIWQGWWQTTIWLLASLTVAVASTPRQAALRTSSD